MNNASLLLVPAAAAGMWLLYQNGLMVVNSKRAVSFVGRDRGRRASFTACTGTIRRIVRFPQSKNLRVVFSPVLTKGSVAVELQNSQKQTLLRLDEVCPTGSIFVEKGQRYHLVFHFRSATGEYSLQMD
jgi:hypothetical protein